VNDKTFDVDGPTTYSLPKTSSSLTNGSTGKIDVLSTSDGYLTINSPSGQAGTVSQDGVIDTVGPVTVQDPFSVLGGSICGTPLNVGIDGHTAEGGSLKFGSPIVAGPSCGANPSDQIFFANITSTMSGNIPTGYTVTIGNNGSSYAVVAATTKKNQGTLIVEDGATITFATKFKNKGTFEVTASGYTTVVNVTNGNFTNSGTVELDGATNLTITNTADGFINSANKQLEIGDAQVNLSGPLSNSGILSITAGGTLNVSKTFVQVTGATYAPQVASSSSVGVLNVTGTASLGGTNAPTVAAGYTPVASTTWVTINSAGLGSSTFTSTGTGFSTQYISTDKDVQITAT